MLALNPTDRPSAHEVASKLRADNMQQLQSCYGTNEDWITNGDNHLIRVRDGSSNEHVRMFDSFDSTRFESNGNFLFENSSRTRGRCSRDRVELRSLLDRKFRVRVEQIDLFDRCSTRNVRNVRKKSGLLYVRLKYIK